MKFLEVKILSLRSSNEFREMINWFFPLQLNKTVRVFFLFLLETLVLMFSHIFSSIIFPIFIAISIISYRSSLLSGLNEQSSWYSTALTHRELINNLFWKGFIKDERILNAMRRVDRADFVNLQPSDAYSDRPQPSKSVHVFLPSNSFISF